MEPKRSDSVIVHELLAFVQHKLDVMDELSLEQICTSSYSEDEILSAKKALANTAVTTIRFGTWQSDGRSKEHLRDIFRVLKETDPNNVPTFVVRDLRKLPPVTFDHLDVTRLLKDIAEIRSRLAISEQTVANLKMEVAELRSKNAAPTISPKSAQNITLRRRRGNPLAPVSKSVSSSSPDPVSLQVVDRPISPVSTVENMPSQLAALEVPPLRHPKTFAQVSRVSQTSRPPLPVQKMNTADKDGFTLVEKKKRRPRPARNQRGTAPAAATTTTLRAAVPLTAIYLSRFDQSTSGHDVVKYITEKCCGRVQELSQVKLEPLQSSRTTNFRSFVLRFPAQYKEILLDPKFWPEGIVFRRYRDPQPKLVNP